MTPDDITAIARAIRRAYPRRDVRLIAGDVPKTEATASLAERYRNDSVGFLRDVLHFHPTPPQERIALALPGRVKVNAGHSVGKTALAAALSLWWFYTRDPGIVITTAPTERDVIDLLWTEIRLLHGRAGLPPFWAGPRAPEMFDHPEHWAKGYTARSGESLDADTVIDTPDGRCRFGDLRPGDRVFGSDGTPTRVAGVHRNGVRPAFRVRTSAGCEVVADAKHLWAVTNVNNGARGWLAAKYGRRSAPQLILTTQEIIDRGVTFSHAGRSRVKFALPTPGCAQYDKRNVTIPPYTLGVWLGDGTCFNGSITTADPEIYHELKDENPDVLVTHRKITTPSRARTVVVRGLRGRLRAAGLLGGKTEKKRVPREYLENDVITRLAVLQGLMDTDGCADKSGGSIFCSTSKGLVEDAAWITRSLGGRAVVRAGAKIKKRLGGGEYKPIYTVNVRLPAALRPFRLPRKLERLRPETKPWRDGIESITPCGDRDMVCITVEAKDGLFLANDFVVTHNSFQGRHRPSMFFIFDESEGISTPYWLTLNTMFQPDSDHCALAIGNPTTTSSQSYLEDLAMGVDGAPKWKQFVLSSLDHPNILAELEGKPRPIPHAVSLAQVNGWVAEWCSPIPPDAKQSLDFEWPPGSGVWYRPGPNFKARALGVRPTEGVDTVWSHKAFEEACYARWTPRECWMRNFGLTVGIDAGGYGDDDTAIHVRTGPLSLHHESRNGWEPGQAAGRAKELISEWAAWYNSLAELDRPPLDPLTVPVVLEFDGGYGVGVHSHRGEFSHWYGITVGSNSEMIDPNGRPMYANLRAELWFEGAAGARGGQIDISRLPQEVKDKLRIQLVTPFYENLPNGTKRVEPKREVKKRLGRSPDDADSFLISHHQMVRWAPTVVGRDFVS